MYPKRLLFIISIICLTSLLVIALAYSSGKFPRRSPLAVETPAVVDLISTLPVQAQPTPLPADSGFVNVKDRGARGDGTTDDTSALQALLGQGKTKSTQSIRSIYIPNGVYSVSDTLIWGDKRKLLWGQNRDEVVIKLKNNSPGFQDQNRPKKVLQVEFGHGGQNFNQRIRNITVDVGKGNPGAIGIGFHTNNGGGLQNVAVKSSDPQQLGHTGIRMDKPWPGPGFFKNVWVDGFDTGILITHDQYSMTFEHITLTRQRKAGFVNILNTVAIRDLKSKNRVPAIQNKGKMAMMALLEAELTGGDRTTSAIENSEGAVLFVRDLKTQGYTQAIQNQSGQSPDAQGPNVKEFVSHPTASLFSGLGRSLQLPIETPPDIPYGDPSRWVSVIEYGATPNDKTDDGPAIQKAIDSGSEIIYLPPGLYHSRQSLRVRGNVRRILGLNASMIFKVPGQSAFIVEDGKPAAVAVEVEGTYGTNQKIWIEHASKRTLLFTGGSYMNSIPGGKVFIEDIVATPLIFDRQKVWIRQANTESYDDNPHIVNQGSDLWILGLKTEKDRTIISTTKGGRTEVIGGLLYKNRERLGPAPAFIVEDSDVSLTYRNKGLPYLTQIVETQNGVTKTFAMKDMPAGNGRMPLYTGYRK
jgi:Pectate lyase superfamily protein